MHDELQALAKTHTWDLGYLLPRKIAVLCKWVYKIKTRSNGSIELHKAHLVAKGFTHEYGINYEEKFAHIALLTFIRSLLTIIVVSKWPLFEMDVKNAFLNGDLIKKVMQPPPGYSPPPNKFFCLHRALHGLKQAPRAWFAKFNSTLQQFGFASSAYDSVLFIQKFAQGIILVLLYVDDMIITGSDLDGISTLKQDLNHHFEMKDLGTLSYFLGLEVSTASNGYYLSQAKYASNLLSHAGLTDSKTASTPLETNVRFTPLDGTPLRDPTLYRTLVGSLVYLTITCPNIAYVVHLLYAYSDAAWAGDLIDRHSNGFCFFLSTSLISWRSKKQTLTARSSTEAEYHALANTIKELSWLLWMLEDMVVTHSTATSLYCDNGSAFEIAHNYAFHKCTKNIEIDCHFVLQHVVRGVVCLHSVTSLNQTADIFTKSHPSGRLQELVSKLQWVRSLPS
ncbi:hypothetical protein RJ639_027430 [Escallonia herrerae]|uniref:Reverse transcriptase Ty1/copia-type domain-containing protein n=1 Tax=Escallonia herrerae TaxID=1293975 RepID=A0AA88XHK2_9ASTE|nr:hypothetical protein RJ639_027430 [Escallonia herrerae]